MNVTVPLALFGAPVLAFAAFALLRSRRAVFGAFVAGWLFLPMASYPLPGGAEYSKVAAVAFGLLAGVLCFDAGRLLAFRPAWLDLPAAVWCLSPFVSSMLNGLGPWDGLGAVLEKTLKWGAPYFLGRLYVTGVDGLRDLALAILAGGIAYLPLCLFEARMSPQLHTWVYGYHQHSFAQTYRFGGWRPVVFLPHGLAVGMWMSVSSLIAVWLWTAKSVDRIWRVPVGAWALLLLGTTVLCRSAGSLLLLAAGLAILLSLRFRQAAWPALILLCVPLAYIGIRSTGLWDGAEAVRTARLIDADRAESLQYRFSAEDVLVRHALRRPGFGWGGWGRNRPSFFDEEAENVATDGLWIIALGNGGAVALAALLAMFALPPLLFRFRVPGSAWLHPRAAPASVLAVVLLLYLCDSLMNAMPNPVTTLAAGALTGALAAAARPAPAPRPAPEGGA